MDITLDMPYFSRYMQFTPYDSAFDFTTNYGSKVQFKVEFNCQNDKVTTAWSQPKFCNSYSGSRGEQIIESYYKGNRYNCFHSRLNGSEL